GAMLTGSAMVAANASDNAGGTGVVLVQFLVDGGVVATSSTSPYSAQFNSAGFVNGSHAVSARAWDAAGNTALSALVVATTMNDSVVVTGGAGGQGSVAGAAGAPGAGGMAGQSAGASGTGNAGAPDAGSANGGVFNGGGANGGALNAGAAGAAGNASPA